MAGDEDTPPTEETPPDRPNIKKQRLQNAVSTAEAGVRAISPLGTNPASAVSSLISSGWTSDPTADNYITDLDGQGTSIKSAFDDAVTHYSQLAAAEPDMVAHDDPRGDYSNYSGRQPPIA